MKSYFLIFLTIFLSHAALAAVTEDLTIKAKNPVGKYSGIAVVNLTDSDSPPSLLKFSATREDLEAAGFHTGSGAMWEKTVTLPLLDPMETGVQQIYPLWDPSKFHSVTVVIEGVVSSLSLPALGKGKVAFVALISGDTGQELTALETVSETTLEDGDTQYALRKGEAPIDPK